MKRFWPVLFIIMVLLAGCLSTRRTFDEKAAAVPRLTRMMHAKAIRMRYLFNTNLPPDEVRQLFASAVDENPSLELFDADMKSVRLCNGEIVLLLCDPKTGTAGFEDASCTPRLDRRWGESNCPPSTFTISHPQTCGCEPVSNRLGSESTLTKQGQ